MGRSQNQAELSKIKKIKKFTTSFGLDGVSDSSSNNKIYSKMVMLSRYKKILVH